MKRVFLILLFVCVSSSAFAQAQIGLRGGLDLCLDNGKAKCDSAKPGYSVTLAPGYQFHTFAAVHLDINFSSVNAENDKAPDTTFFHVIPMLSGVIDTGAAIISIGGGVGYNRLKVSQGSMSFEANTYLAIKAALALMFPINKQLSVGLGVDYVYNGEMEACINDKCKKNDMISQLHANLGWSYSF